MTITVKNIIPFKVAEVALTSQYSPSGCRAVVDKFTATNNTASNLSLTVHLVPPAGAPSAANLVINARTVVPNETYTFPGLIGHVLEPGGAITTSASGLGLTIGASGREIT
jgi:hypothetical protein